MKLIAGLFKVIGRAVTWTLLLGALAVVIGIVAFGKGVGDANQQAGRLAPLRADAIAWAEAHLNVVLDNPESVDSSPITNWGTKVDWYYGPFARIQTLFDGMQQGS
jgi:hypothetical protein